MDTLLELAIGVLGFAGGIVLFRLFKPKSIAKENQSLWNQPRKKLRN
jgi:hypothetical protein